MNRRFLSFIVCLISFLLFTSLFPSICFSKEGWSYYVTTDGVDWFYDKSSIVNVTPNIIRIWIKSIYTEKQKNVMIQFRKKTHQSIDGWEALDNGIYLYELDCLNHTYNLMKSVDYDYGGNILEEGNRYPDTKQQIRPDTIIDGLRKKVCK